MARIGSHLQGHSRIGKDAFKPTRDRVVRLRTVVCPSCRAAVGEPCLTASGAQTRHASRRVMALRAEREAG